jgi:hypothetical protein
LMSCARTCAPSAKRRATDDIDPALLSCAERKRWEQHRKKTVDAVLRLPEQGTPLKQIAHRLNLARQTVRRIARDGGLEVFRSRVSNRPCFLRLSSVVMDGRDDRKKLFYVGPKRPSTPRGWKSVNGDSYSRSGSIIP